MTYPQAPWKLKGHGFLSLHWVETDRVRPLIPQQLQIFSPFPGKTLGGVYVGSYTEGSTLRYSELIGVPALVYHQGKIGAWISHIYVDNPDSMAGGQAIWGLPKEMAQFEWETPSSVTVQQGDRPLCHLKSHWNLTGIENPIQVPAFSLLNSQLVRFSGQGDLKWHWAGVDVRIPLGSPLADLGLGQPWMTILLSSLDLNVSSPLSVR